MGGEATCRQLSFAPRPLLPVRCHDRGELGYLHVRPPVPSRNPCQPTSGTAPRVAASRDGTGLLLSQTDAERRDNIAAATQSPFGCQSSLAAALGCGLWQTVGG